MTLSATAHDGPPRAILMATNLGPGSDRALDRARVQARAWEARLVVVHVIDDVLNGVIGPEPDATESHAQAVRQIQGMLPTTLSNASIHIESGDTAEAMTPRKPFCGWRSGRAAT